MVDFAEGKMATETAQENPRLRVVLEEAVRREIPERVRKMGPEDIAAKLTEMRTETQVTGYPDVCSFEQTPVMRYVNSLVDMVCKDPVYLLSLGIRRKDIRRELTGADRDRLRAFAYILYQERVDA